MLIVRSPLRIPLGGGGTDLPSYSGRFGGELIAAGINKYVFVALKSVPTAAYRLRIDQIGDETSTTLEALTHPLAREFLRAHEVPPGFELCSFADIPPRSGLGSSGAFAVALLKGLSERKRRPGRFANPTLSDRERMELAEQAFRLETEVLGLPTGRQDPYASAYSGLRRFIFERDGSTHVELLNVPADTRKLLERNLLLFFTDTQRSDHRALQVQRERTEALDAEMIRNLDFTKELGQASARALESGNLRGFAELLDVHWQNKRKRGAEISNPRVDLLYDHAKSSGALGGKLIGGGGAGFLLCYADNPDALAAEMTGIGAPPTAFAFDDEGTTVVHSR